MQVYIGRVFMKSPHAQEYLRLRAQAFLFSRPM